MPFTIDTGAPQMHVSMAYDYVIDMLPDGASEDRIDLAMAHAIMGEFRTPKTLKTVRKKLLYHWGRLAQLAETHPETFDAVLLEYAELSTQLP